MADDLIKSLRSHSVVLNSVLEILAKHGHVLGEFANQFAHELTATQIKRLESELPHYVDTITT